jgi:hypothetical protein
MQTLMMVMQKMDPVRGAILTMTSISLTAWTFVSNGVACSAQKLSLSRRSGVGTLENRESNMDQYPYIKRAWRAMLEDEGDLNPNLPLMREMLAKYSDAELQEANTALAAENATFPNETITAQVLDTLFMEVMGWNEDPQEDKDYREEAEHSHQHEQGEWKQ